jgi:hypothetical protein
MMYKKFLAYSLLSLLGFYLLIIFFQPNFFNFFLIVLSIVFYLGLHAIYFLIYIILNSLGYSKKDFYLNVISNFIYVLILISGIGLVVYGHLK